MWRRSVKLCRFFGRNGKKLLNVSYLCGINHQTTYNYERKRQANREGAQGRGRTAPEEERADTQATRRQPRGLLGHQLGAHAHRGGKETVPTLGILNDDTQEKSIQFQPHLRRH